MRSHIAKALQKRCKAIQRALQDYNKAAASLNPPRPPLEWSEVSHYGFLDEFTLLRENREEILSKPWARPVIRETIKQANRIARAHEEVERCNIEARRLLTFILDEHDLFDTVEKSMKESCNPLLVTVQEYCARRRRINIQLLARISQIHTLDGFTGERSYGTAKGSITTRELEVREYLEQREHDDESSEDEEAVDFAEGEDDHQLAMDGLVDFVSHLAV